MVEYNLAKAAFVVLYDVYLAGKSVRLSQEIEDFIYRRRQRVILSRKEAQHILEHPDTGNSIEAALVLIYEGVGKYRMEDDFSFAVKDLLVMNITRKKARLSIDRAIPILQASIGGNMDF